MSKTIERGNLVKKVFNDVLERESNEREEFLAQICGEDTELQTEIKSLLDSFDRVEDFLQTPAAGFSASEVAEQILETEEASAIGKKVGAYRIEREIGRGGMGIVYLARREDGQFQKRVAVKLLRRGTENDTIVRRFHNERQILADLEHPNIARLIDGGTTENGLPYFVMEYVEGLPLNHFCNERVLSIEERLKLFREICAAVQFAHEHSIIHRDIKPSNILVTETETPKLLDFGIAKTSEHDGALASTATALRVMTPEYASPEQIRGERVTKATDIYSLGILLYELTTGQRPYNFDSKSPYEIVQAICEKEPIHPSSINNGQWLIAGETPKTKVQKLKIENQIVNRRLLKNGLDNIILKSIRKEPERRYASVEDFSEDVLRLLEGLPVSAQQDTIFYRSAKFLKRHHTTAFASCLVAFVFLLLGFSLSQFSDQTKINEPSAARLSSNANENLPVDRKKGGTNNAEARNLYLKAQSLWNQRTLLSLRRAAELFDQATEKDPEFALAFSGLSNTYFLLSVWGTIPAKEIFPQAKAASLKAIELAPEVAEGHLSLAMIHWLYEYDWQAADNEFKKAIELNPVYVQAPHWYGLFLAEMGRFDEAVQSEKLALTLEPDSIAVNADLARVLFYARRYDESLAQYQRTIEMNPNFEAFYLELVELYEAKEMIGEWEALMTKLGNFDNPVVKKAYETGGIIGYWQKTIELFQKPEISGWHNYYSQAVLYAQTGNRDRAFELLNKAFEVRDHRMAQVKVSPKLDNLRSDIRFKELLRRMKLKD